MTQSSAPFVVITGASAGIGADTATLLAEKGYRLFLGARRHANLEKLASRIQLASTSPLEIHCHRLDVCSSDSVDEFCKAALEAAQGQVDVLINNAGLARGVTHLADGEIEDWRAMMDTNFMGVLRVTRALLPSMIRNSQGHLIMLGSIAGQTVYEGGSVYCATKHALKAITKTLRLELNGTPIKVTSIDPGMVETEFSKVRLGNDESAKSVYKGLTPLTGRDIAECIAFAIERPSHVNIDEILLMPIAQAAPHKVDRSGRL